MRCAVLGSPVAHSLSPVLHRAAYAALGLDWQYDAHEVPEDRLAAFLDGLDDSWRGLSLTMPLKRAVVPLLDTMSDRAVQAQAVNTLVLEREGGQLRRAGHNTDVAGAAAALRERYPGPVGRVTVLGGGATAASVLLGLADLGCRVATLLVRDEGRAVETLAALARHPAPPQVEVRPLGSDVAPADVLVSTIPAAAQAAHLHLASQVSAVFDVVYDPRTTPLLRAATEAGATVVEGLDLLVHQALLQVELMTGRGVSLDVLRGALAVP